MSVIISKETKIYHEHWCPYVSKMNKKNRREEKLHRAINRGYHACKFCFSLKGEAFRAKRYAGINAYYDALDEAICIKTELGFWKAKYNEVAQDYTLFHMNHGGYKCFDPKFPPNKLARGCFHRQKDFRPTPDLEKIYRYIKHHDENKKLYMEDYRKMPKGTKLQRKYYEQAKKRKQRKDAKRVDQLLEEIQNGSQIKKGA